MRTFRTALGCLTATLMLGTLAAEPPATADSPLRGRIQQIDPAKRSFVVKTGDGKMFTAVVTDQSMLELNGQPARLDQFQEGQRVRLRTETVGEQRRVVRMWSSRVSEEELGQKVQDTLRSARDYSFQKKEEYEARMRTVMEDLDDRLDDLRERAATATAEAKARLAPEIERLREKRDALANRLDQMRSASQEAWEDAKAGAAAAAEDLRDTWDRIRSRFREKDPR